MPLARRSLTAAATLSLLLLAGCHISSNKNGNNDNVDIGTPFGSMHVKTNDNVDTAAIGIAVYPGAVPAKDDNAKNNDSADINLSFGDFHLGVKAASYSTPDAPDKVVAFYKKELAHFGDVLECHNHAPVGQPTRTSQGLTCNDNDSIHTDQAHVDLDSEIQVRTGSPQHQHLVEIDPRDGHTKIGLVALDLPSHLGHDANKPE